MICKLENYRRFQGLGLLYLYASIPFYLYSIILIKDVCLPLNGFIVHGLQEVFNKLFVEAKIHACFQPVTQYIVPSFELEDCYVVFLFVFADFIYHLYSSGQYMK